MLVRKNPLSRAYARFFVLSMSRFCNAMCCDTVCPCQEDDRPSSVFSLSLDALWGWCFFVHWDASCGLERFPGGHISGPWLKEMPFLWCRGTFRLFLSGDCLGIRIFVLSKYFEVFCVVSCCCSRAFFLRFPVFFAFRSDGRGRDSGMEDGKVRTSLTESAVF